MKTALLSTAALILSGAASAQMSTDTANLDAMTTEQLNQYMLNQVQQTPATPVQSTPYARSVQTGQMTDMQPRTVRNVTPTTTATTSGQYRVAGATPERTFITTDGMTTQDRTYTTARTTTSTSGTYHAGTHKTGKPTVVNREFDADDSARLTTYEGDIYRGTFDGAADPLEGDLTDYNRVNTSTYMTADKTIAGLVMESGQLNTLESLVKQAGLADMLDGMESYTVFAPVDAAFARLSDEQLNALTSPAGQYRLKQILSAHVVPGTVKASDIDFNRPATSAQGEELTFTTRGGQVFVDDIRIVATDMSATNGVVHLIDGIIIPK